MPMDNPDLSARRPIKTRDTSFARSSAQFLDKQGFSPNFVSVLSMVFATAAALCVWFGGEARELSSWFWWLGAILGIQCRLLCNLFDGMIAVEGGKSTPNGDLYNEIPDRYSDVVLFVAAGYACQLQPLGAGIGWATALGCVLTAYIRQHGASLTQAHDFGGPMAKAQRMFLLTVTCLLLPFSSNWGFDLLLYSLACITFLTFLTFLLRLKRLSNKLCANAH